MDTTRNTKAQFFDIDGNELTYESKGVLGEGKFGIVYHLTDGQKDYALKIRVRGDEQLFQTNALSLVTQELPHFVKVEKVGTALIDERGDIREDAILMEYGGSDLDTVYKCLDQVDPCVAEAFRYKAVLTALEAFKNMHTREKPIAHRDFNPRNYVCGFDIKDFVVDGKVINKEGLEEKLIHQEMLLCDRAESEELVSLANPSLTGKDYRFMLRFVYNEAQNGKESDVYAVTFLASWMLSEVGSKTIKGARLFAKAVYGSDLEFETDIGDRMFLDISTVQDKLDAKINGLLGQYFILDELKNSSEKTYPVVLRPMDKFKLEWANTNLSSRDDFSSFYEGNDFSYLNILKRKELKMSAEESSAIISIFGDVLLRNVEIVSTKIKEKLDAGLALDAKEKPIKEEKGKLEQKFKKANSEKSNLETQLDELDVQVKNNRGNKLLRTQREEVNGHYDTCVAEISDLDTQIKTKVRNLESISTERKKYDYNLETTALHYVVEKCLNDLDSGKKKTILDILTKRGITNKPKK